MKEFWRALAIARVAVVTKAAMTARPNVCIMIGHDDDVVLDPQLSGSRPRGARSKWEGRQSDVAIAESMLAQFPHLRASYARTIEELLATDARVVLVLSYLTQVSYSWYARFFAALQVLEARGVTVYPSANFKEYISSKALYMRALQERGRRVCPTHVMQRDEVVDAHGEVCPARLEGRLRSALTVLGLQASSSAPRAPFQIVSKPSNADGGFGVAFWSGQHPAPDVAGGGDADADENANQQRGDEAAAAAAAAKPEAAADAPSETDVLPTLRLCALLTAGNEAGIAARKLCDAPSDGADGGGGGGGGGGGFCAYLRTVAFADARPHLLLQPFLPQFAHHFEMKIYFLRRELFFASLTYGKEKLVAKVVRPSTHAELFRYLQPLVAESQRVLDALPPDGPHDPKVLLRVDWGCCSPAARASASEAVARTTAADEVEAVRRDIVQRASSLGPPQKRLKRSMQDHAEAPLDEYLINEVEVHPGFYVDWDADPDATLEPLGRAYGEYVSLLLEEQAEDSAHAQADA